MHKQINLVSIMINCHRYRILGLVVVLLMADATGARADTLFGQSGYPGQPGDAATTLAPSGLSQAPQPVVAPPPAPTAAPVAVPLTPATNTQSANAAAAAADTTGRVNITEENDYFFSHNDRHYTQGARASYLSGAIAPGDFWDAPYNFLANTLPIYEGGDYKRKYDWTVIGQSIFTPQNTETVKPGPKAWPYGAWLYTGAGLLQEDKLETHHTLENFEVLGGIVGPGAFGNITQNDFHELIGVQPANGWRNQLHNEPGLVVSYERKWRFQQPLPGNFAIDAIPESGVTLGNVFTYGDVGGMVRFGQNLGADYGPSHIRPSLSGTSWFDKTQMVQPLGWYLYAGTQGRAIARNIFLDGNTFESSPSVDHRPLVADFLVGASLFWTDDLRLDVSAIQRTQEYYGQKGYDRFGSIDLAFVF